MSVGRSGAVRWFGDLTVSDTASVGGKGANLGEMTRAGLPVPPGFVIVADAYLDALEAAGVRGRLAALGPAAGGGGSAGGYDRIAAQGSALVRGSGVPVGLRTDIVAAYRRLGDDVAVAVRSSAPAEDSATMSFAGIHESFTNVVGAEALVEAVLGCWASLWSPRAVAYRDARHYLDEPSVAVVVQRMVPSETSGVMFTADPRTGDGDRIMIEAALGLGEVVVGGQVEPDTYVLAKHDLSVLDCRIGRQAEKLVGTESGQERTVVSPQDAGARVLTDEQLRRLGELAVAVEAHYSSPQDMEWAFAEGELYVLQTRPITTLTAAGAGASGSGGDSGAKVLASGLAAGPGVVAGRVRILESPGDAARLESGEVLVASMTDPDWLPALRRAAAIVTDHGGITCHAAIVGRELHRPVVVAARTATVDLEEGRLVTVDGNTGVVLDGDVTVALGEAATGSSVPGADGKQSAPVFHETTATGVLVNLAVPDDAERVAALPVDGVGLLRAEFMITEALGGVHPSKLLAEGRRGEYVEAMAAGVRRIAAAFSPRPVVYRAVDLRSNEFRGLEGGEVEPEERNPMIGYRGCFRYVTEPELFDLDLDVIASVRQRFPNVHLMIPFVRTLWELEACLTRIDAHVLGSDRTLQRWIMAEVPSVVYWLPRYADLGIHGVSIGTNDLTQLMLGVDRDSEVCSELFDTMDEAVLDAIGRIVERGARAGLRTSLCGQAASNDTQLVEHLVRLGISSVSVDPSVAALTRRTVASAERRILLDAARGNGPGGDPARRP